MSNYVVRNIFEDGNGKRVGAIIIVDGEIGAIVSSYQRNDFNYDRTVGWTENLISPFRIAETAFLNDAYHTALLQGWVSDPSMPVSVVEELRNRANTSFVDLAKKLGDEAVKRVAIEQLANSTGSSIISGIASEITENAFGQLFVKSTLASGVNTFKTLVGLDAPAAPDPVYLQDVHFIEEPDDVGLLEARANDSLVVQFGRGVFREVVDQVAGPIRDPILWLQDLFSIYRNNANEVMIDAKSQALQGDLDFEPINLSKAQFIAVSGRFVIDLPQIERLVPLTAPTDDHADSHGSATVMSAGTVTSHVSATGKIGTVSDQDWFSAQLQAGSKYAFVLWPNSTTNSLLDPRLTLRTPDGQTVTNDNLSATTLMSFISFTAAQSGTHYLRAEGTRGTTGDFVLTALPIIIDPTAGGLGPQSGDVDLWSSISWHWEGTSGDDRPSELTLESGGRPQTSVNNFYRGHDGDDRIYADSGSDVVWGDDGEDRLYGEDGNDTLRGGRHDDSVYGGDGEDLLYGEHGDDYISASNGDDTLYGGDDDDKLRGNDGNDYIKGEDDNDDIDGGAGNDQLYGDRGADSIEGGSGNDFMMGGAGNDVMDGDAGHDRLAGEDGNDFVFGDDGDDAIYGGDDEDTLQGGEGNDILHGEDGIDTADFTEGVEGVRINLFDQVAVSIDLGIDNLYEIENIKGSEGDDVIDGDHGTNVLDGYQANDNIRGHNGADTLLGGTGNDTLWGDLGNDFVSGDADDDELRGGLGSDTLYGGIGDDHLRGEQENDTIDGGDGIDTAFFWGEREDFSIVASGAAFSIADLRADGLEGQDFVTNIEFFEFFDGKVSASASLQGPPSTVNDDASTAAQTPIVLDVLQNDSAGSLGTELLSVQILGGAGTTYVVGNGVVFDPRGAFDHLVFGATATVNLAYVVRSEALLTSTGTVQILVTSAQDRLVGDRLHNELYGYEGNDLLNGAAGDDILYGGVGNDILIGGTGNDQIDGGDGSDHAKFAGTVAVAVNLALTTAQNTGHGTDIILNIEHVTSGSGNDHLTGNAMDNRFVSGDGNDTLDGGAGIDRLIGGTGDDLYFHAVGDVVVEGLNQGIDTVRTTAAIYTLAANVENVAVANNIAHKLTGNVLTNAINGNVGADTLYGVAGNDTLDGGAGIDRLIGGIGDDLYFHTIGDVVVEGLKQGIDTVRTAAAVYTLAANVENLVAANSIAHKLIGNVLANAITGDVGADTLYGVAGDDTLDGGVSIDLLIGGSGDDTYIVTAGDVVVEGLNQGLDTATVTTGTGFSLGANIEVLRLAGVSLLNGTGNALANVIVGNGNANVLRGFAGNDGLFSEGGNDILIGGAGQDTLTGGAGNDQFRLTSLTDSTVVAPDLISDFTFSGGQLDRIGLNLIDANTALAGDQAFAFIGGAAFSGAAGQLRVELVTPGVFSASGDVNGDAAADFAITIQTATAPVAGWFLL
jgi:Ca2+-binding RTX toxin-like protein